MNFIHGRDTFPHCGLLNPARCDVSHLPAKKPIPTDRDTSVKQKIFRPIPRNGRTTKAWTAVGWPANKQSETPDGQFGPARQMPVGDWNDCWFIAALGAVANDPDGHKMLAESIKKVKGGYNVTFKGMPNKTVFISKDELKRILNAFGGDADTRLMELAADKLFSERGNFISLYIAQLMREGMQQAGAERCLQDHCQRNGIQDPTTHNPMRNGTHLRLAFFLFTNRTVDRINAERGRSMESSDVMSFLNQHLTDDRRLTSIAFYSSENLLGNGSDAIRLALRWDAIRTEITSNGTVDRQERAFLNALDRWLATRISYALNDLKSAAGNLNLEHSNPVMFVNIIARNLFHMNQDHFNLLRSSVQEVLAGRPGFIGFPEGHSGTIEGINEATNTFTYSEPNRPTLVHTGALSDLIQAIRSGNVYLIALPKTGQHEAESSHAGEQRGRHLRQIHHQAVADGKIDPSESGPLANLMEMDDGAFWQVYDSDKNSVIEGGELKAVQLRVDRWVDHFKLAPIPPNDRTINDWTTMGWPTNIQSRTPDGKFGPAKQMEGWNDCWFLASLAAVANDQEGHKILTESIKKVTVEGISGYHVTFTGSPNGNVFISDDDLQKLLDTKGGDADTRLMELAADRFFKKRGNFRILLILSLMRGGKNQEEAEQCFDNYCQRYDVHDPMTYNPMRDSGPEIVAFFMFAGMYPDRIFAKSGTPIQKDDVMRFLNQHTTNDPDGVSIIICGEENPLGNGHFAPYLVCQWDVIRTEITSNGTVDEQQRDFLEALDKWLKSRSWFAMKALKAAAGKLKLEHVNLKVFISKLADNQYNMKQKHFKLLRSAVQEVLAGGPGYIGFPGSHAGTIEGIDKATNTFTYCEPYNPTLVHTGELNHLIQAIIDGTASLQAVEPTAGQDEAESSHAGEQRGRHLRQIHHQAVADGKIDSSESGPLANLMEMDDGAFWQVYDSDKNSMIEASEMKAVQLRVDRWVDHLKLTPIW